MSEPQAPENPNDPPIPLTDEESYMLQANALAPLRKAFRMTPLEDLLSDDGFSGKREFKSLRRRYEAEAHSDIWQREITLKAALKRSTPQQGRFIGEGVRFIIPKKGSSRVPLSEHLLYSPNGEVVASAPANTTTARDNVLRLATEIEASR